MKIVIYGSAVFPVFFKEVIRVSQNIDWYIIVPSYHFRDEFISLLGPEKVFYTQEKLNILMSEKKVDLSALSGYHGSIYADLATDKHDLRYLDKEYQLKNGFMTYLTYKNFLLDVKPDCVLFPIIESSDAKILYSVCKELGIETALSVHARNLGVSFFSRTSTEDLPEYAFNVSMCQALPFVFLTS